MNDPEAQARAYEQLAYHFANHAEPRRRDHCLVLAAVAALSAGRLDEAERLRQRLLHYNPYHLLRPYSSIAEALQSQDVRDYVEDLRGQFPPQMLDELPEPDETNGVPEPEPPPPPPAPRPAPPPPRRTEKRHANVFTPLAPPPTEPEPPKPPPPKVQPLPVAPPAPRPAPMPARPAVPVFDPAPPLPVLPAAEEPVAPAAAWLATMLFFLGVLLGLGVFFITFVWPLLD